MRSVDGATPTTTEVEGQLLDVLRRATADDGVAPDDLADDALGRYLGSVDSRIGQAAGEASRP
jgi:hypothetical protein